MPDLPSIHSLGALEDVRAAIGLQPHTLRRLRNAIYKHGLPPREAVALLEPATRTAIVERVALQGLDEVRREDSSSDGATKLVLRTRAGLVFESVILRIRSGRSSVCVSAQVGCAVRCEFCATGHMGVVRNLDADEIVEQVALAGQILRSQGRRLRNVVFMGMGEPMHNRAAVEDAVARLIDPAWFALSPQHILVSTVGVVDELRRFVERFPQINLALSLHAARPEVRARLMPHMRQPSLPDLHLALREIQALRRRPMMIEYLLLEGINDSDDDLAALIDYCRDLDVHLNLIPFNPIEDAAWLRPSTAARQQAFAAALKAAGLTVTTRFSLGKDIAAACGQLVRPGIGMLPGDAHTPAAPHSVSAASAAGAGWFSHGLEDTARVHPVDLDHATRHAFEEPPIVTHHEIRERFEAPAVCFNKPDDLANLHGSDDTSVRRRDDARSIAKPG